MSTNSVTAPGSLLSDVDGHAASVLTSVKLINSLIFAGMMLSLIWLGTIYFDHFFLHDSAVNLVKAMVRRRKFVLSLPAAQALAIGLEQEEDDGGYKEDLELQDTKHPQTGKTSYTLSSSDLQKLIDENIVSRAYGTQVVATGADGDICRICEKKLKTKEMVKQLATCCGSCFHAKCLSSKIKKNKRDCPSCGRDFTEELIHGGPIEESSASATLPSALSSGGHNAKSGKASLAPAKNGVTIDSSPDVSTAFRTSYYHIEDTSSSKQDSATIA